MYALRCREMGISGRAGEYLERVHIDIAGPMLRVGQRTTLGRGSGTCTNYRCARYATPVRVTASNCTPLGPYHPASNGVAERMIGVLTNPVRASHLGPAENPLGDSLRHSNVLSQ